MRIPTARPGRMGTSTLPRRQWAHAPTAAAGTMLSRELPWATCWLIPMKITIPAIMKAPPPMPRSPATNPVTRPVTARAAIAAHPVSEKTARNCRYGFVARRNAATTRMQPKYRFSSHSGRIEQ